MKNVEEYFVPWVKGIPMYISGHIELAWRKPELHRMMSNENPNPPSEKVLETIIKYAKMANRYPDQGLVVRGKIAQINGLGGAENVMLGRNRVATPSRSPAARSGRSRFAPMIFASCATTMASSAKRCSRASPR